MGKVDYQSTYVVVVTSGNTMITGFSAADGIHSTRPMSLMSNT